MTSESVWACHCLHWHGCEAALCRFTSSLTNTSSVRMREKLTYERQRHGWLKLIRRLWDSCSSPSSSLDLCLLDVAFSELSFFTNLEYCSKPFTQEGRLWERYGPAMFLNRQSEGGFAVRTDHLSDFCPSSFQKELVCLRSHRACFLPKARVCSYVSELFLAAPSLDLIEALRQIEHAILAFVQILTTANDDFYDGHALRFKIELGCRLRSCLSSQMFTIIASIESWSFSKFPIMSSHKA